MGDLEATISEFISPQEIEQIKQSAQWQAMSGQSIQELQKKAPKLMMGMTAELLKRKVSISQIVSFLKRR